MAAVEQLEEANARLGPLHLYLTLFVSQNEVKPIFQKFNVRGFVP
jgi:hypothetical protein